MISLSNYELQSNSGIPMVESTDHADNQNQDDLSLKYGIDILIKMAEMSLSLHDQKDQQKFLIDNVIENEDQLTDNTSTTISSDMYSSILFNCLSNDENIDNERSANLFYQAISHRMAANSVALAHSVVLWKGNLPFHRYSPQSRLSNKIFIGGLPWECTHAQLLAMFSIFGTCNIETPNSNTVFRNSRQQLYRRHSSNGFHQHQRCSFNTNLNEHQTFPGFVYIVFNCEKSVHNVLNNCCRDEQDRFFYALPCYQGRRSTSFLKKIQIIPWDEQDTYHVDEKILSLANKNAFISNRIGSNEMKRFPGRRSTVPSVEVKRTVFVGALHGMITASGLAKIMSEMFGPVDNVLLDTDKHHYPIGSGRVTFVHHLSYQQAIRTQFVRVKTQAFDKTIQIDPYLYDEPCFICSSTGYNSSLPINRSFDNPLAFCRSCMVYFCSSCWYRYHYGDSEDSNMLTRNRRRSDNQKWYSKYNNIDTYSASDMEHHIPLIRSSRYTLQPNYQMTTRKSFP